MPAKVYDIKAGTYKEHKAPKAIITKIVKPLVANTVDLNKQVAKLKRELRAKDKQYKQLLNLATEACKARRAFSEYENKNPNMLGRDWKDLMAQRVLKNENLELYLESQGINLDGDDPYGHYQDS